MHLNMQYLRKPRQFAKCFLLFAISFWWASNGALTQEMNPSATAVAVNPAEQVKEIRVVGNTTITSEQVASHLTTRVGRPFDRSVVQRDVRRLANLGWFIDVKPLYETTPQGRIVIFQVVERPTIRYITYLGNEEVPDKKLAKETGLQSGGAIDPYAVEEARRKLEEYYQGRGFNNAQVTILEGTKPTDKGISFLINEGTTKKVWNVEFVGNEFVSSGRLKSIVKTKPPTLMVLKGYVNREQIDSDVDLLTSYYRSFGFFQAKISRKVDYYESKKWAQVTFVISEGPRYQVRSVKFLGNTKFEPVALSEAAKLQGGEPFEQAKMGTDAQWIKELYGSHGYVFADVRPEPVFLEEPGEVDLLYHIEEGEQFHVGRIIVNIEGDNPHTRIQTAMNRMSVRPGDVVDIREINASERRLVASGLFHSDPATGVRPKITYRISEETGMGLAESYPGDGPSARVSSNSRGAGLRGQSPDMLGPGVLPPPSSQIRMLPSASSADSKPLDIHVECHDWEHYQLWLEAEGLVPSHTDDGDRENNANDQPIIRGQSPESSSSQSAWWVRPTIAQQTAVQAGNPYQSVRGQSPTNQPQSAYATLPNSANSPYGGQIPGATGPASKTSPNSGNVYPAQYSEAIAPPSQSAGVIPGFQGNPVPGYQVFPNGDLGFPGQPYPAPKTVDVIFNGMETQTGRLQVGAGINSNAGIVGNIVIDERNFDWKRLPRSWEDFRNGTAFRGAGQRFRIDASPGSSVNRYLMSFQEPYLFDSPISLGLSGSYFDRRYDDWDEGRLGGRISLGYQWLERDLSTLVTYRGENVNISNIATAPGAFPDLDEVVGNNNLQGFKLGVINDTRDSSFLPTQGHYLELGAEQVLGSFVYPRIEADFRTYWLMRERPDHSGRHVVSYSTAVGWMGEDAPIYDRFYAGGYATLRGYRFRGASPVTNVGGDNIESGGDFQWLNSLQYLFPITADDMLHGVVFCDFGTVEQDVSLDNFRVAPGLGLRVTVPAMGPAPIALDFAFPVSSAPFDREQVFSFSLGFGR
ncbi:Outer membrane protein assembly factor BamA precursor [Bythopirellula goksoeyrii]|uniref:Outer membrane protein assembly factor BamA n=2 Tax=Bythopirellula goksoeyrii TaxID=1400387 RepID=A0A5B9Q5M0_9BACT|nr:Outer membrane protein assembly factor BamA precursor [Bythopirellula goksoeyrii]